MAVSSLFVLAVLFASCTSYAIEPFNSFVFVNRAGWGARASGAVSRMQQATHVVIHHTFIPGVCTTQAACAAAMRSIQNSHMNANGWSDIGYNFAVGGEGRVYEGRGWRVVGAHAVGYNSRSVGIVLIGDWRSKYFLFLQLKFEMQAE
ncbi:unnamed protein product [Diatraea saccharalis]|uniref:Peptidoglycan recognition protein family domain-containing protein n=1 Tax=Diatraea saccharalis TaxID=40085 RepID=A0A9P0G258_9NEOP|nr:unnamed protein product [Diatraea saccharalis]